jgi:hypothetical protein
MKRVIVLIEWRTSITTVAVRAPYDFFSINFYFLSLDL